jgi:biopolymer transport protein ExbB
MQQSNVWKWNLGLAFLLCWLVSASFLVAQDASEDQGSTPVVDAAALSELTRASNDPSDVDDSIGNSVMQSGINFLSLLVRGGWMMIPIGLMSVLVVTVALERLFALRKGRIMPKRLVRGLQELSSRDSTLDPVAAFKLCQRYPSPAASVIKTMLLKIGRPHSEIEHAVAEASQREADYLYANVRWLNMATAVTPLMGLLGTVWGMIEAFHATTQLVPGQDRAEQLAEGIYIALVTTLAGLMVAIPSAVFAHYYEGKITAAFRKLDELLFELLAQVERFEGQARFDGQETRPIQKFDGSRLEVAKPPVATGPRPTPPPPPPLGSSSASVITGDRLRNKS